MAWAFSISLELSVPSAEIMAPISRGGWDGNSITVTLE